MRNMREFISNVADIMRNLVFGALELLFLILTLGYLVGNKVNYSIACGIITICFLLLDANNKLYDLKKSK